MFPNEPFPLLRSPYIVHVYAMLPIAGYTFVVEHSIRSIFGDEQTRTHTLTHKTTDFFFTTITFVAESRNVGLVGVFR